MNHEVYRGRIVYPLTSLEGQLDYFEHLNRWGGCVYSDNIRQVPTREEADEYIRLMKENPTQGPGLELRLKYLKLQHYHYRYDWRPIKSGDDKFVGLLSPAGEQILPEYFADVFTQFDAINDLPDFIPVYNGVAWALVSVGSNPILMTDFVYSAIIPVRWERKMYFVQGKESGKWGAFRVEWKNVNENSKFQFRRPHLIEIMPCIADEIYEDQLMTEEEPTLFFMTCLDGKIGILTDFGYSEIKFDRYEANDDDCSFRLIRDDRKRARRADLLHPDGKNLMCNIKRRYKYAEKKTTPAGQI